MADSREDRQSFFVVRKPDNAILIFCCSGIATFLGIFIVSWLFTDNNWVSSLLLAYGQITRISALSIFIVLFIEGVDIMRSRYQEAKARTQKLIEEAYKKGFEDGFEDGKKSVSANKPSEKDSSEKPKNRSK